MVNDLAHKVAEIIDGQLESFAKHWGMEIKRPTPFVWEWDGTELIRISVYPAWVVVDGADLNRLFVDKLNEETVGEIVGQVYEAIEAAVSERYYGQYRGEWVLENGDLVAVIFRLEREKWSFQTLSASGKWNCVLIEKRKEEPPFKYFDAVARSAALLVFSLPMSVT